jgi:hypothetical protein
MLLPLRPVIDVARHIHDAAFHKAMMPPFATRLLMPDARLLIFSPYYVIVSRDAADYCR